MPVNPLEFRTIMKVFFMYLDGLKYQTMTETVEHKDVRPNELLRCLQFHCDKIQSIQRNKKLSRKDKIDGLIFHYTGHGDQLTVFCSNGKKLNRSKIHSKFDVENCPSLKGLPKIFIYDCCRGGDTDELIDFDPHVKPMGPITS